MSEYNKKYKPIKTVDHSFVVRDNDESKFTAIRINEGKFKNVIYFYEEIQTGTETKDGGLNLHFSLRVVKSDTENPFEFKDEFHQIAGDILVSCLEKGLTEGENVDIIYRDNDTESLAEERELHPKSVTFSEG